MSASIDPLSTVPLSWPVDWPSIQAMQEALALRKLYTGKLDGQCGPMTLAAIDTAAGGNAPWMDAARAEFGVSEIAGARHEARIIEYHSATTLKATDDETPWCSSFVNWVMLRAGITRTRSAAARSWLKWGETSEPRYGAVCILSRGAPPSGHVAFVIATIKGNPLLLGGNQGNRVKVAQFVKASVLGYRWPA